MSRESKTHPSYGLVQFSRVQGNNSNFFGSEIKPNSYISLKVTLAEEEKDLGRTWYYPKNKLIEVRMTNTQFADLVTSLNMGSGVPCTIIEFDNKRIEQDSTKEYKADFHKRRMKEKSAEFMKYVKDKFEELKTISSKLSKKDQQEVHNLSSSIAMTIEKNFPWYIEQFYEEMEQIAQDIKSNMEADVMHRLSNIGLTQINENKLLGPTGNDDY